MSRTLTDGPTTEKKRSGGEAMLTRYNPAGINPPFSAPGVMLVMLSTNRSVATSISFIDRSRLTEMR